MVNKYYIQDTRTIVGNNLSWWARGKNGYVCDVRQAHVFTKEEAEKICANRNTDVMWPKEYIDARVSHEVDHQRVKNPLATLDKEVGS